MPDNLNIKGVESDQPVPGHGRKPKKKSRKRFAIECRIFHENPKPYSVFHTLGLHKWWVHSAYKTRARRDQALAALVKKADNDFVKKKWGIRHEYRALDR